MLLLCHKRLDLLGLCSQFALKHIRFAFRKDRSATMSLYLDTPGGLVLPSKAARAPEGGVQTISGSHRCKGRRRS